jgi:hypothetical protein
MEESGFLKREHREMLIIEQDAARLLDLLRGFVPARVDKRISVAE